MTKGEFKLILKGYKNSPSLRKNDYIQLSLPELFLKDILTRVEIINLF